MKTYIVDRIEDNMMVLEAENGQMLSVPHALMPEAKEGDCICVTINKEETEKRRASVRALMDKLFED